MLARRRRYAELMGAIQVPVLLLHGEKDRLVPLAAARAVAARNPAWRFAVARDVGHVPQLEAPEWTVAQIREVLRHAGLVETSREGTSIYYRLAGDDVAALVDGVRTVASTRRAGATDAAAAYLGDRSTMQQITAAELRQRIKAGDVDVIDVRPTVEYEAGHIPTARSIPIEQLEQRLDELSADTQIVAYCRGPWCVYAPDAARLLEGRGYEVRASPTAIRAGDAAHVHPDRIGVSRHAQQTAPPPADEVRQRDTPPDLGV